MNKMSLAVERSPPSPTGNVVTDPLRVLLVDDSATDAKLIVQELRRHYAPIHHERVEDGASLRAALEKGGWDVITCDWSMPKFNALAALELVRRTGIDIPFIIVSGTIADEAAIDALRCGAHDYVLKDHLARLTPAVERELRDCKDRATRRDTEAAFRGSEVRFRRLYESGIIGIVTADVHGNILDANDKYLAMVGYSREELRRGDVRWGDLTPPEFKYLAARSLEQLQASGVAPPRETETLCKDGSRIPTMVGVAMLEYPNCIAVVADLTDRNVAQAGRLQAEVTLLRTEDQLRQAQKMEAIGRLAGGVAHDFNNLLSVILSYSTLLKDGLIAGDPMRDDLEEIQRAGERAAELTRQLLTFSRQQTLKPQVLDLGKVLTGMEKMLPRLLGEDIEIRMTAAPRQHWLVYADPGQIEQIVMNLAVNARDAMPNGGKLTIEVDNVQLDGAYARNHIGVKPGPHVMLAVSDNGIGMDEATKAQMFEPFFTTKEVGKGTGLGLSTVYGIVQQSGGTIWAYSELGTGTTFKVYFPRTVETSEARLQVASLAPRRKGTETILLVEDEDQVRNLVRGILERNGYAVLEASNGGEALLLGEKHPGTIHLLLTDVIMPRMNGRELADRLAVSRPLMKVLFVSGYTGDVVVHHGILEEGATFLQKPITPEALLRTVGGILDGSEPARMGDARTDLAE